MEADGVKRELVGQWLDKAAHDMLAVERLAGSPELGDIVAFHCQQAAEKALKAFLTWHDVPFRKTHLLVELVRQCSLIATDFESLAPAATFLTPFASEFRYPGTSAEPTPADIAEARRLAQHVVDFVRDRLPTAGA